MQTARKRRLIPRRWVVERTIAWINRCRRLAKDYENLNRTAIAFIRLASIRLTGREIERIYIDKGYRGHDAAKPLRVFKSGQKRGVHGQIKKELRRRSAIDVVIDHCKTDGHLDRNFLHGRLGDQITPS